MSTLKAIGPVVLPGFRELFSDYVVQPFPECSPDTIPQNIASTSSSIKLEGRTGERKQDEFPRSPVASIFPPSPHDLGNKLQPYKWDQEIPQTSDAFHPRAWDSKAKRYVCTVCTRAFHRPSSLATHMNSHTGERPYRCPFEGCDKSYGSRSNMQRHYRNAHAQGRQ